MEADEASDVVAFAAPSRPAPAPAATPLVAFAPDPPQAKSTRDTSLYEAANMQASEEAPRPAPVASPAFPQQNVGGTRKQ